MKKGIWVLAAVILAAGAWHFAFSAGAAPAPAPSPVADGESLNPVAEPRIITISDGTREVSYGLNDSTAAMDLYQRLPLKIELKDYSDNEKNFYPGALDVSDTPRAKNREGTLAYYGPWKDVVLFYGPYRENEELYELGRVLENGDRISQLRPGMVTIEKK